LIKGLRGKIVSIDIGSLSIDVSGVIYEVFITYRAYEDLKDKKEVYLPIYHSISERGQKLFGFSKVDDRELFIFLRSLNGIGEATSLKILSYLDAEQLLNIVTKNEKHILEKIPKIKGKTSEKILFELKQNIKKFRSFVSTTSEEDSYTRNELAIMALMKLGFDEKSAINEVDKVIKAKGEIETSELIKEVLHVT
jgi:holliday junction DNA helicase RuvA